MQTQLTKAMILGNSTPTERTPDVTQRQSLAEMAEQSRQNQTETADTVLEGPELTPEEEAEIHRQAELRNSIFVSAPTREEKLPTIEEIVSMWEENHFRFEALGRDTNGDYNSEVVFSPDFAPDGELRDQLVGADYQEAQGTVIALKKANGSYAFQKEIILLLPDHIANRNENGDPKPDPTIWDVIGGFLNSIFSKQLDGSGESTRDADVVKHKDGSSTPLLALAEQCEMLQQTLPNINAGDREKVIVFEGKFNGDLMQLAVKWTEGGMGWQNLNLYAPVADPDTMSEIFVQIFAYCTKDEIPSNMNPTNTIASRTPQGVWNWKPEFSHIIDKMMRNKITGKLNNKAEIVRAHGEDILWKIRTYLA